MDGIVPDFEHALQISGGKPLGLLPKCHKNYLDRTTINYGASGTGKSYLIREQCFLLKDFMERIIVFTTTNDVNKTFDKIAPKIMINNKPTAEKLIKIYNANADRARLYTMVHSSTDLAMVVNKMNEYPHLSIIYNSVSIAINEATRATETFIQRIKLSNEPYDKQMQECNRANEILEKRKTEIYRRTIRAHKNALYDICSSKENTHLKVLIDNLDINPRLLVIFDDCLEELHEIAKRKQKGSDGSDENIVDKFFSRGRWAFMTIIIGAQNDAKITPHMRRSAFLSIFTEHECAIHFMNSKVNSLSKPKKDRMAQACTAVFDTSKNNYKKLVYCRLNTSIETAFMYAIAGTYPDFRVGSDAFWAYCDAVQRKTKDEEREFLARMAQTTTTK